MPSSSQLLSPQKHRFDTISGHHTSPVSLKKLRTLQASNSSNDVPALQPVDSTQTLLNTLEPITNSTQLYTIDNGLDIEESKLDAPILVNDETQQHILDAETHNNRLAIAQQMTAGKGTESAYARHMKNYYEFWEADQVERLRRDPFWKPMPAEPITVRNAALFLQYETTRTKVFEPQAHYLVTKCVDH